MQRTHPPAGGRGWRSRVSSPEPGIILDYTSARGSVPNAETIMPNGLQIRNGHPDSLRTAVPGWRYPAGRTAGERMPEWVWVARALFKHRGHAPIACHGSSDFSL